jgi:hypothetical protein
MNHLLLAGELYIKDNALTRWVILSESFSSSLPLNNKHNLVE